MRLRTSTIQRRHLVPRCVACGQEVAASRAMDVCAGCGCDLADRPARSYAEMEGLVEVVAEIRRLGCESARRGEQSQ